MTPTSSRRTPPSEDILRQWQTHNPFERASADLIKQVQRVTREQRQQQPQGEPAPF